MPITLTKRVRAARLLSGEKKHQTQGPLVARVHTRDKGMDFII